MMSMYDDPADAEAIREPRWNHTDRVHDWRNHVPRKLRAIWHTFTDEQRLVLADVANDRAGRETWD